MQHTESRSDHVDGYSQFLEMPVPVVLAGMWLMGTTILGACGLVLYALVATLVGA